MTENLEGQTGAETEREAERNREAAVQPSAQPAAQPSAQPSAQLTEQSTPPEGGQRRLSRRRFLTGAAGGAAALVAAACGKDRATSPLPTPTQPGSQALSPTPFPAGGKTYLPLVENNGAPIAPTAVAVSPVELPTSTPTPIDTPTPEPPTPTPTPPATPFPPGPPSKIGLFVSRNIPQIFDLLATGAVTVVKTLELDANFVTQIKRTSPNTLVFGRISLPQLELAGLEPLAEAQRFVNGLMAIADDPLRRQSFDGWESYNEPVPGSIDDMKRYAEFEAERTRLLAERGIRSVIGNFGTGQPPLEWWEYFLPAVQSAKEHNGWLGLHEYSAPTMYFGTTRADQGRYPGVSPQDSGWLTLRYRKVYNEILKPRGLAIPLAFTELGVDGLVTDRPGPPGAKGWQDFQGFWAENGYGLWGPGAYIEQLVWYDAAMRQDDYVVGGCLFVLAASDGWQSYDIMGPAASVLQQYLSVHAPV